jgi:hypothetical protein
MPKISQFTEDADPQPLDYIPVIDSSSGVNKRLTFNNLSGLMITESSVISDHETRLTDLEGSAPGAPNPGTTAKSQIVAAAAGLNTIDLALGTSVHIASTAGAFSVEFTNVPAAGVEVTISVNVTTNNHEMTILNSAYIQGETAPVTADWDAGETMVIRTTKLPYVDKWINEWLYVGTTPTDVVITPPTLTAFYSTDAGLASPVALSGATLPAGDVAIFFGPSDPNIVSMRIFCLESGTLPAVGEEGDSYVGTTSTYPYRVRGIDNVDGVATVTGSLWDTTIDPTGNNRTSYDENGACSFKVEATLVDATTVTATFSFNTANAPIGSALTATRSTTGYAGASSSHNVDIPDGVDRTVLVVATYSASPFTGSTMILTGMTINGNAMTKITAATKDIAQSEGLGQFVCNANEASLVTGLATLTPTFASSPGTGSSIIYDVVVFTNAATPAYGGDSDYRNVSPTTNGNAVPSVPDVPANSYLFTVGGMQQISQANMTVDLGSATTAVEVATTPTLETRSYSVADSGASATESATWNQTGRSVACIVYLDYSASGGGGGGPTPIIPGTPSVSVSNAAGDNLLTATWSATSDAESYELRHGSTNPPTGVPITGVTSPRVITGLAPSVVRYVQVRAKSSTNDYSAWSTVASGTPTGSVPAPSDWDSTRYPVATNHVDVMMGEGYGTPDFADWWTQKGFVRVNCGNTEDQLANLPLYGIQRALSNYEGRGARATAFRDDAGPRLIITHKLAITGTRQNQGSTAADIAGKAQAILDTAKSGSTGAINRNATWTTLGNNINRTYTSSSGVTYNGWDVIFLSISHENNGSWAYSYTGTNTQLIGRPEFTVAGGATAANYGVAMAAALQRVGATGACDEVHRLAVEHIMEILWSINPRIIIGMTPAAGNGSALVADTPGLNLTSAWIESSFPRNDSTYNFGLDFVCPTLYNRSSTTVVYDGSGSIDDYTNYTNTKGWFEDENEFINRVYGCPTGLLEFGGSYAIPGEQVPGTGGAVGDESMKAFCERILEHEMIVAPGKAEGGLAFINHWNFLRWASVDNPIPGQSYGTWNLIEACWGRFPANALPTSTGKPSFSARTTPMYPKTLAYMQSQFTV